MTTATLRWALILLALPSACERQALDDEPPAKQWSSGCGGWNPSGDIEIAVRAAPIDNRDPALFELSVRFTNEGGRQISLADPRILPPHADPSSVTDPSFQGTYPPVLLRVGRLDAPSEAPKVWTVLLPSPSTPVTPREISLESGADAEMSFAWRAPEPGRYTLQAISGQFGRQEHFEIDPRCAGDDINPLCFAQTLTEQHFEVAAQ